MNLLIKKKSGKPFHPSEGFKIAHAIDIIPDPYKPNKNEDAYLLENGHSINIKLCDIVKDLEKQYNMKKIQEDKRIK